jgi:ribosomal protein S8E
VVVAVVEIARLGLVCAGVVPIVWGKGGAVTSKSGQDPVLQQMLQILVKQFPMRIEGFR